MLGKESELYEARIELLSLRDNSDFHEEQYNEAQDAIHKIKIEILKLENELEGKNDESPISTE